MFEANALQSTVFAMEKINSVKFQVGEKGQADKEIMSVPVLMIDTHTHQIIKF